MCTTATTCPACITNISLSCTVCWRHLHVLWCSSPSCVSLLFLFCTLSLSVYCMSYLKQHTAPNNAPEMSSFAYTHILLISLWTILHISISCDGCLFSLPISWLTYKIMTHYKWHVHEKGHITVSSRKQFTPPSLNTASKNLKLTAIQWSKTRWPQLMATSLRQVLCCLPSHWTVRVKSGASCHIKWK
jgi:hypothetical protein